MGMQSPGELRVLYKTGWLVLMDGPATVHQPLKVQLGPDLAQGSWLNRPFLN